MQTVSLKNRKGITDFNPDARLKNRELVAKALWECLVSNDVDAFKEILR
jgi:hypothetical protein